MAWSQAEREAAVAARRRRGKKHPPDVQRHLDKAKFHRMQARLTTGIGVNHLAQSDDTIANFGSAPRDHHAEHFEQAARHASNASDAFRAAAFHTSRMLEHVNEFKTRKRMRAQGAGNYPKD